MQIIHSPEALHSVCAEWRRQGLKTALVPTMGYYHAGHASLISYARSVADKVIVSLFVNPTQFGPNEDLEAYPRDFEKDSALVRELGGDVLYAPEPENMYAPDHATWVEVPAFANTLCGLSRPIHFRGVCTVVLKLFMLAQPSLAVFGEKDWQQIAVIKQLVKYINSDVKIVECPIIRDEDGLAKSSRNTLLAPDERAIAPNIYKALKESVEYAKTHTVQETHDKVVADINAVEGLEVEYFQIVDGDSLQDVASWEDSAYVVGCITVYCGKTPIRLIDHIKYKG